MATKPDYRCKIDAAAADDRRQGRVDYATTAFMVKRPHSGVVVRGPFLLPGRAQHRELVEYALARGLHVWYAAVGGPAARPTVSEPHLIDWDSLPGGAGPAAGQDDLCCGVCGHQCSSRSGLALHARTHAAEAGGAAPDHQPGLRCPHCQFVALSASGYTLHLKKHQ